MARIYLHPLPVRIWHWINAVICILLFLTGIQLRYIGLINAVSFRTAVIAHNVLGFILIANFCLWLGFYLCSPRIRNYHAETNPVKYFIGAVRQTVYYSYGIFRNMREPFRPTPYRKFNPLQDMTYQLLMIILMPVQILTGILLWNLAGFPHAVAFFGGVRVINAVHVAIFIFFAFYIPAHIYLGSLGPTPLARYKEMITGYEDQADKEEAAKATE